jgi:hypothetical protein
MGSWNGTCAVSNLHVTAGQKVVVFILLENKENKTFCYGNALYDVCPIPFYGEYDDYGAVENCHGFGLDIVVEALRNKLYRFGVGANETHDCEVNRDNFSIEKLFEADHEDRLGIEYHSSWNNDSYNLGALQRKKDDDSLTDSQQFELDRLASKIKKVDTFRRATHVIIHGDVFTAIMEKWYIEDYVGDSKGDKGYKNNYRHIYFKDMTASIPAYIDRIRKHKEEFDAMISTGNATQVYALKRSLTRGLRSLFDYKDECIAGLWMEHFNSDTTHTWGLIDVSEHVDNYVGKNDWDGLQAFATEVLTAAWVNSFMSHTRKVWTKQTGQGSQNGEPLGYQVLANIVLDILAAEKAEYDEYNIGESDQMDLFYDMEEIDE